MKEEEYLLSKYQYYSKESGKQLRESIFYIFYYKQEFFRELGYLNNQENYSFDQILFTVMLLDKLYFEFYENLLLGNSNAMFSSARNILEINIIMRFIQKQRDEKISRLFLNWNNVKKYFDSIKNKKMTSAKKEEIKLSISDLFDELGFDLPLRYKSYGWANYTKEFTSRQNVTFKDLCDKVASPGEQLYDMFKIFCLGTHFNNNYSYDFLKFSENNEFLIESCLKVILDTIAECFYRAEAYLSESVKHPDKFSESLQTIYQFILKSQYFSKREFN